MDWAWFSILIGWLAKLLILRFGGPTLYHRARPVFVGMIFGETVAGGIWLVINLLLSANGHAIIPAKFLP